jgi:hypothetical protein
LLTTIALLVFGLVAAADADQPREQDPLTLTILMTNDAHLPEWLLTRAEREVERIFLKVGIELRWSQQTLGTPPLRVAIMPQAVHYEDVVVPDTMAFTLRQPPDIGGNAYVFFNRVERRARMADINVGLLLGAVIAHEIGHMLIPGPHAPAGLMRASWNDRDMRLISAGALDFSRPEADLVQTRLLAHAR